MNAATKFNVILLSAFTCLPAVAQSGDLQRTMGHLEPLWDSSSPLPKPLLDTRSPCNKYGLGSQHLDPNYGFGFPAGMAAIELYTGLCQHAAGLRGDAQDTFLRSGAEAARALQHLLDDANAKILVFNCVN